MMRISQKRLLLASGCVFATTFISLIFGFLSISTFPISFGFLPHTPIEQMPTDKPECIEVNQVQGPSFRKEFYPAPNCSNIGVKMTDGFWEEREGNDVEEVKNYLDELLVRFRVQHEGFSGAPFRGDGRCGFKHQFSGFYNADASTWCAPSSSKPCCSDNWSGICIPEDECISPNSVNLAKYVHAEVSNWIPRDKSCKIVEFGQKTACSLLHEKQVKSVGFIGNSLIRNMYSAMLQMLTNNYYNGSIAACISPSLRKKCVNYWQNMDKFCLGSALVADSEALPGYGVCNGHLDTLLYQRGYWMAHNGVDLTNHINKLLDHPGTYLVVGIGVHDRYNARKIRTEYLTPAFLALKGHEWPKFLWIHQLKSGIFKPTAYINMHGSDADIDRYVEEVEKFCKLHNIPALDLRPLTSNVWSIDGTHYNTGVNVMKVQMFLNLLASNSL